MFEWSNKVTKKYVSKDLSQEIHDKAAPFLTWLQEAEEEDSEPEEEDDDLEVNVRILKISLCDFKLQIVRLPFVID